ncbi:glycosyltransferase family 2 protein [Reyranella sp.]|uniref:glycosyltransferase family 2 protein n=1 Tax=Reyranella sp. TaxID=1929291 RepID=UPI0025DC6120|nr:glycosyltransferase family 2 protein [Reyranella sp.]
MRITATLIARDEEHFLPGCLQSIRPLVDEIVVVDTGSRDATRAIARAHGARLHDFAWRDDFSAARNFALDQAGGDWILYIDADERLRPLDRATVERELSTPEWWAATLRFHPQTGYTAYRELRLFRRHPEIRFQGAMHETIVPSLNRLAGDRGEAIGTSTLTIDHLGYDGGSVRKHARDLGLLRRQIAATPDRTYLWWHLGSIERERGDPAAAERAWRQGVEAARRSPIRLAEKTMCFAELARQCGIDGRNGEALALIAEARTLQGDNYLLDCLEARSLAATGRCEEALAIFESLASIDADMLVDDFAYDRALFGAGALAEGGLCLFRLERYADSAHWFGRAVAREPGNLAFRARFQLARARAQQSKQKHHRLGSGHADTALGEAPSPETG